LAVGRDPAVELRPSDDDFPSDAIAGQRVARIVEAVTELAHAEPGIAGERPERKERIERCAHHDTLGQYPSDLGDGLLHRLCSGGSAGR